MEFTRSCQHTLKGLGILGANIFLSLLCIRRDQFSTVNRPLLGGFCKTIFFRNSRPVGDLCWMQLPIKYVKMQFEIPAQMFTCMGYYSRITRCLKGLMLNVGYLKLWLTLRPIPQAWIVGSSHSGSCWHSKLLYLSRYSTVVTH